MASKNSRLLALSIALALAGGSVYGPRLFAEHDHKGHAEQAQGGVYTCPMHPEYTSEKPGDCPKCGMHLVPKKQEGKTVYTCPMHPDYTSDKPGKCPECGMNLEAKKADTPASQDSHAGHNMANMPTAAANATPAQNGERKILYWYDPMHPQYKSDKPGKAPDCGMDLVPKYEENAAGMQMAPGAVMISPDKQQLIGVRTAKVERQQLTRTVRTTGQVTADETKIAHVHVKISGFVDKVFVDYVGQTVKKGQPLFTIYSPDLVSAQQEYLIAKRGQNYMGASAFKEVSDGANSLLRSARERLQLWDISDAQIDKLDQTGEVSRTMTFYSPITGIVQDRKAFPQTSVNPDTELYTVADLSTVWVNADVYEYEVPFIRVGQQAEVQFSYYPGRTWRGRVSFIYPAVDPETRTVKVRLEFPNPKLELKPQMFADVQLKIDYGKQIVVPQEAVLDSGAGHQTIFVARDGGYFEPRQVKLGTQLDGKVAVLSGLKAGETVVTSGNFLIDSESKLKNVMPGMQH